MGMQMSADLELGVDGCSFTLDNWNMAMSVPAGGSVSGTDVAFTGSDWDGCTGVVSEDGTSIAAECPAGGGSPACSFTMESSG